MTKVEFDKWFTENYNYFITKFSKQYHQSKEQIAEDLSDFYIHVIDGNRLNKIEKFKSYLASFIYYRHYQFFAESKAQREGYLVNNKKVSIKLYEVLSDLEVAEEDLSEDLVEERLNQIQSVVNKLPLDYKILYDLRYVKGLKIHEIAALYGLQKPWISKKLKRLREKVKECLN